MKKKMENHEGNNYDINMTKYEGNNFEISLPFSLIELCDLGKFRAPLKTVWVFTQQFAIHNLVVKMVWVLTQQFAVHNYVVKTVCVFTQQFAYKTLW